MTSPTQHPNSWFSDPSWLQALQVEQALDSAALARQRIKGIPAAITPPWALETGEMTIDDAQAIRRALESAALPLVVCDLPPGVPCTWEKPWIVQQKHTRWLQAIDGQFPSLPKHRSKQVRKALAQRLRLEPCADVALLLQLHQQVRERKSISSDTAALKRLLTWILTSPNQSSYVVYDDQNQALASATFLHNKGRTIYAFGGQERSKVSALATVLLIQQGIRDAEKVGNDVFDFGGSADEGVDRFYAEFGAQAQTRFRAILVKGWARPWLRVFRPDLF
ncbi:MAG: GNAT family N-acetyltransferase [Crocinitomicaceae bacterium TMED209]|nr:MAG: GNAT family N-acetyltransferase [Crocinitomicaceae bacterium TMED209]